MIRLDRGRRAEQEFEMLHSCARTGARGFHLWGVNQEAYGAGGLILPRILERGVGDEARRAILQLLQENEDASRQALQSGRIFDFFNMSADDAELARAAAILQKDGSAEARKLFGQPAEFVQFNLRDQPGSRYLEPMFANLLPQDWTMFDLRALRSDARVLGGAMSADLATLVFGVDTLVIVPEGTPPTA